MRRKPTSDYCGITLILDEPSRFDKDYNRLLSGPAEEWMNNEVLKPFTLRVDNFDVRDLSCNDGLLDNTRAVILMGNEAANKYSGVSNDPPGYLTVALGKPAIPVFFPQDCCDYKNMRRVNTNEKQEAETDRETKEKQITARENYRFWTKWHVRKFLSRVLATDNSVGNNSVSTIVPIYYPHPDELVNLLNSTTAEHLYLDIETSRMHGCLSCIGFSTDKIFPRVYVIPVYLYNGQLAYTGFYRIYKALSLALSRNTVVIHNAMFDLLVLCGFYHMCYPRGVYDTMATHHRCFLEQEKSLAHAISTWTWQPNHKDFSTEVHSKDQEHGLWEYNAKDVYNLKLIMDAQLEYAKGIPGLLDSINQCNESIVPYLDTTLTGLPLDMIALAKTAARLERHKSLFTKICTILTGAPFNPGSQDQCAKYFHGKLNYDIVSKTPAGKPAMGGKQLYQLQLKYNNPLLAAILKYRTVAKDLSMLESELLEIP